MAAGLALKGLESRQSGGDEKAVVKVEQTFLSANVRITCHPEDARPASVSSAGRPTKDLLRHRVMSERPLSFAVTWQAARLRLHDHSEEAHAMSAVQRRNHSPLEGESQKPSRSLSLSKGRRAGDG